MHKITDVSYPAFPRQMYIISTKDYSKIVHTLKLFNMYTTHKLIHEIIKEHLTILYVYCKPNFELVGELYVTRNIEKIIRFNNLFNLFEYCKTNKTITLKKIKDFVK